MATSIRLAPEIQQRLNFLASQTGRSKAYYLREVINHGLEDLEDYYLATDVLERVRKGREAVHPVAAVRKDLGLDDCRRRPGRTAASQPRQTNCPAHP